MNVLFVDHVDRERYAVEANVEIIFVVLMDSYLPHPYFQNHTHIYEDALEPDQESIAELPSSSTNVIVIVTADVVIAVLTNVVQDDAETIFYQAFPLAPPYQGIVVYAKLESETDVITIVTVADDKYAVEIDVDITSAVADHLYLHTSRIYNKMATTIIRVP